MKLYKNIEFLIVIFDLCVKTRHRASYRDLVVGQTEGIQLVILVARGGRCYRQPASGTADRPSLNVVRGEVRVNRDFVGDFERHGRGTYQIALWHEVEAGSDDLANDDVEIVFHN